MALKSVSFLAAAVLACAQALAQESLLKYVNTLQGTDSHIGFSHGGTLPLVGAPWPMVQWAPQTFDDRKWFDGGGWWFQYGGKSINGFRATRQPSPWMGDYGQFSIMPTTGVLEFDKERRKSEYDVDAGVFQPDYCRVDLKRYGVRAELTAAERCAVMRFTFADATTGRLVIDPGRAKHPAHLEISGRTIRGYSTANNGGVPKGWKAYFVIQLDRDITAAGMFDDDGKAKPDGKVADGDRIGAYVEFATGYGAKVVEVRVGTSYLSYEQAELNLKRETEGGFDATRGRTAKAWEANLSRLKVTGGSEEEKRTFYSCLYRAQTFPHKLHEFDADNKPVHQAFYSKEAGSAPGILYGDNGFWDVYRTNYSFWALAFPEQLGEILEGFTQAYRESGWFPQWPAPGHRSGMLGSHIDAVVADAVAKKIKGFDVATAYEGIRKNAFADPGGGVVGRPGLSDYLKLGYVPGRGGSAVSKTLDYAYDDWCVAQVARALGKTEDEKVLLERSKNYRHLFDPGVGFFRAKKADGSWDGEFDEFKWGDPYVEGGAWQCNWAVAHDVSGLAALYGGNEKLLAKLDQMMGLPPIYKVGSYGQVIHEMTEMAVASFGQYAHSNQPGHHVLYLFAALGRPASTQYWTRRVCQDLYNSGPKGFCGDEDNGEMAAWYLLSAMGVFPMTVGNSKYVLTAPLFDSVTLEVPGRKPFTVSAAKNERHHHYVQSRTLNGETLKDETIEHETIVAGGELKVELGARPMEAKQR